MLLLEQKQTVTRACHNYVNDQTCKNQMANSAENQFVNKALSRKIRLKYDFISHNGCNHPSSYATYHTVGELG